MHTEVACTLLHSLSIGAGACSSWRVSDVAASVCLSATSLFGTRFSRKRSGPLHSLCMCSHLLSVLSASACALSVLP